METREIIEILKTISGMDDVELVKLIVDSLIEKLEGSFPCEGNTSSDITLK